MTGGGAAHLQIPLRLYSSITSALVAKRVSWQATPNVCSWLTPAILPEIPDVRCRVTAGISQLVLQYPLLSRCGLNDLTVCVRSCLDYYTLSC